MTLKKKRCNKSWRFYYCYWTGMLIHFTMLLSTEIILIALVLFFKINPILSRKIPLDLQIRLEKAKQVDVFVSFVDGIESSLKLVASHRNGNNNINRINYLEFLRESLIDNMKRSQDDVTHFLATRKSNFAHFTQFWITNTLFIEKAELEILQEIVKDPKVASIREEGTIYLFELDAMQKGESYLNSIPWGIEKIQAPQAWSKINGLAGEGIIVATIDTGVRHTHESLAENFLGIEYGWYDASKSQDTPFDVIGHGTHVTATMSGKGVGVASGTKWSTCAMCSNKLKCLPRYTLECGQFFLCPTLPNGSHPDCSKTPGVISNAWGSTLEEEWKQMIKVWHAAGIIPVFALGNSGPLCSSTYFPGNSSDVIAVGNTASDDSLHPTSSIGPTTDGRVKPDIVAPGTDILSASGMSDNQYHVATGSSMSAPHVAGAIALLLGIERELTFEQVKSLLFENADRDGLKRKGKDACQSTELMANKFPNNYFGYGRLNVLKAIENIRKN